MSQKPDFQYIAEILVDYCDIHSDGLVAEPVEYSKETVKEQIKLLRSAREDLVPESNDVLSERIAELTRKNSELQARISEQSKVIEHIAKAVGEEADPMACWESVDALKAQVELLNKLILNMQERACSYLQPDGENDDDFINFIIGQLDGHEQRLAQSTPAQCLAEVKAQAVEDAIKYNDQCNSHLDYGSSHGGFYFYDYVKQLRQQSKAGMHETHNNSND